MLVEDVATGERQRVAADFPARVGQEIVVQCRRWRVVEVELLLGVVEEPAEPGPEFQ
jgi:hypothetical protein